MKQVKKNYGLGLGESNSRAANYDVMKTSSAYFLLLLACLAMRIHISHPFHREICSTIKVTSKRS